MRSAYVLLALALGALALRALRRGFRPVTVDLSGVDVLTADGARVAIGTLVDRPVLLLLLRYYG